jgi:4-hydroxythreonine-4-phosphate dehydrogenase
LNVFGTFAADSYFANKTYKKFDATLAVYHDQGLTPFKMLSGKKGVNYTGGLKIVRTSPDHGTAFDIAGKGLADISSSIAAVKLALKIINS